MVLPSSITLARKMSLPTHSCPIPVGENAPVVLLDFTSKGLNISNNPDLLDCFLNLRLPELADTNPVDFTWIHTQQNTGTELATKAAKYPN